jgi:CMP/dCMP kinase
MFITIAGDLGSGKSTVGRMLAKRLGYEFFSIGDLMGEIARDRGVTLMDLSRYAEKYNEIDTILDEKIMVLGKEKQRVVLDSRLGWHFIPSSIKIYLKVELEEGARRILNNPRSDEPENTDLETTKENLLRRKQSEIERYSHYYGIKELDNPTNYDLVINTTHISAEDVVDFIMRHIEDELD